MSSPNTYDVSVALCDHMIEHRQYRDLASFLQHNITPKDDALLNLIQLAIAYLDINVEQIHALATQVDRDVLLKTSPLELRVYCYAHYLNQQFVKHEYMDYFRGLSPVMVDLFRLVLEHQLDHSLEPYLENVYKENEHGQRIYKGLHWNKSKIESGSNFIRETWKKYYGNYFNYSHYVSSSHLIKLITDHVDDQEIVEACDHLREIEKSVRNLVAHEIIHLSEALVEERSGYELDDIHQLLQQVCMMAGLDDRHQWAVLNEIDKELHQQIPQYLK